MMPYTVSVLLLLQTVRHLSLARTLITWLGAVILCNTRSLYVGTGCGGGEQNVIKALSSQCDMPVACHNSLRFGGKVFFFFFFLNSKLVHY